ncbi:hypothetical protein CISG_06455 [Coccidioides immitis RMSCC 3703]|uniref:Uncharacterized protein n=1 Tax=Coccidioides immitis RMSCC 3703 TaxID=454286 RepID=A0A0J8R1A2_COCIT|nr:hypothetical protein CISG_06455 [Coccidioides immitis RMSCC 3703]
MGQIRAGRGPPGNARVDGIIGPAQSGESKGSPKGSHHEANRRRKSPEPSFAQDYLRSTVEDASCFTQMSIPRDFPYVICRNETEDTRRVYDGDGPREFER